MNASVATVVRANSNSNQTAGYPKAIGRNSHRARVNVEVGSGRCALATVERRQNADRCK